MKDALPGTGRGGSTSGHSTGQGYSQEGRGVTSGTGQPVDCPAGGAFCANSEPYWLHLASLPVILLESAFIVCDLDLFKY